MEKQRMNRNVLNEFKRTKIVKKKIEPLSCSCCNSIFYSINDNIKCPHCIAISMKTVGDYEYWTGESKELTIYETEHHKQIEHFRVHNRNVIKEHKQTQSYERGSRARNYRDRNDDKNYRRDGSKDSYRADSDVDWRKKQEHTGEPVYMRPKSGGFRSDRNFGGGGGGSGGSSRGGFGRNSTTQRYIPPSSMGSNWR